MKKFSLSLLASLGFVLPIMAQTDNSLCFTDAALLPGEMTSVELCMKNTDGKLTCFEAEIQLPAGISVVCDTEGRPMMSLYRNRIANHELLANVLENGNLKMLVSSVDGSCFAGTEGPLLSFCVQADAKMLTGEYAVEAVGESLLVNRTAEALYSTGVQGTLLVLDDPTDVQQLQEVMSDAPVYNLSGQRVHRPQHGIFIQGGRKIFLK